MAKKVQILDTPGCPSCVEAERIIRKIKKEHHLGFTVETIDVTMNPEILKTYQIMSAPGIVIDGALFSIGKPHAEKLKDALLK